MIGALSGDHPIAGVARQAKDFTYPDALADALLHPQDRAYTVPQLYAGWSDAVYRLGAGSSRLLIFRSAEQ